MKIKALNRFKCVFPAKSANESFARIVLASAAGAETFIKPDMDMKVKKPASTAYVGYEAWAQQHKEQTGEDVSFF